MVERLKKVSFNIRFEKFMDCYWLISNIIKIAKRNFGNLG